MTEVVAIDPLDLARWQFGITTVYHFFFVPVSIGLSLFVAILQTRYHRTGDERFWRLTLLFGNLLVINFAMGVATGIVQEFQFGMNWSDYSRFVGDIFGAPLALEALLAFFLEATFLGLWMFGRGRLHPRLHLACIWVVAIGTMLSAYFILALNSFMQHPVGYRYNEATGRAELTDFGAVLTNSALAGAFPHVITSAWLTASALVLGVCVWHLYHSGQEVIVRHDGTEADVGAEADSADTGHYSSEAVAAYRTGAMFAAGLAIVAGLIFYREVARLAELGGQAPLSAVLSVVATLLYVVTAVAVAHNGRRMRRVAWVCTVAGLIGVLVAGLVGLADPDLVVARTVWSEFGAGYAFAPLVLPLVAAFWLWWSRPGRTG